MSTTLAALAAYVDGLLKVHDIPDYPDAVNGTQVEHRGPVTAIATAVDVSTVVIEQAAAVGANLLIVHHGLFWGGVQPLRGHRLARIRLLLEHDMALYAAHLPLDGHLEFGNASLLAHHLGLSPTAGFAPYQGIPCGVRGGADADTRALVEAVDVFARSYGGRAITSSIPVGHRTRRWAICTGAGVNASTLAEAASLGVDTLISGEGPHWSAVEARDSGLVIIFGGHYATETLGVRALGEHLGERFGVAHTFVDAPTGL